MKQTILKFEKSVNELINEFSKKQDTYLEFAVKDDITGILCFGDNFFILSDIYFDLKQNKPKGLIFEWQNYVTECNMETKTTLSINYESYCLGARF